MTPKASKSADSRDEGALAQLDDDLIRSAFLGDTHGAIRAINRGADVDAAHEPTGLTALHIASGTGNRDLAQALVSRFGAAFGPDKFGRWPTIVAAECRAHPDLLDFIVDAEASFLEASKGSTM